MKLPSSLFLMFVLLSSVTVTNFAAAQKIIDTDGDGISDDIDNCKKIPNKNQNDKDGDGLGDSCDQKNDKKPAPKTLEKTKEKTQTKDSTKPKTANADPKVLTGLYAATKWAEYSKRALSDAISQDKQLKTQLKQDSKDLTRLGNQIKKMESEIKKEASNAKISSSDLNKAAKEPLEKLKSKKEATADGSLKEAKAAIGKLDSIVDGIEYSGGVDPGKSEKTLTIPEDMKDLPGLGDSAVELKVENKGGFFEGDNCKGTGNIKIYWKLVDPKGNVPKEATLLSVMGLDRNGQRIGLIYVENVVGLEGYFQNMKDAKYDATGTYALFSDAAYSIAMLRDLKETKTKDSFLISIPITFTPDEKEQTFTFKMSLASSRSFTYSGDGDKITVKIPACPKKPASEPKQVPQDEPEPMNMLDSVIDDLVTETVDPFTGVIREKKFNIAIQQTSVVLHDVLDRVEQAREKQKDAPQKSDTKKTPVKKTEQKKTEKSSDEIAVIRAYSIATMMASSMKKSSDLDVLKQIKNELTTQEYRSLVEFLDSRIMETHSSDLEPLRKSNSITDEERARLLVEISNQANAVPEIFNEPQETQPKDNKNQKQPSFEISLKPDSMILPSGGYGEVDVTIKSLNGWNERIWLNIPIPIGPIRYPTMVPKLVTPSPNSDASSAFAVDVSPFSCPGKYRMAVYGMSQDRLPMEIKYTYFNLEITGPDKFFDLSTDQKTITIQKGGSKSFGLIAKNLDNTDHGYLIDTANNFKAPPGVTIDYKTFMHTKVGETSKGIISIKTSENIRTPLTFTLPMRAQTALNCDPTPTGIANVVVHIVGQEDSTPEHILIPGSTTETKPEEQKQTNTKPALTMPKQITQEATGPSGAAVNYSVSGQDKEDGAITPSCSYPSGYTFPIGTTTVSCTVDDSDDNSVSGTFTVTVRDTTPPNIPAFQPTEGVRDETGVQVFFEVIAYDLVDGNVPASCNYPSGYKFPIGTTVLTCTADDSRKNHASKSLQITVTIKESGQ